MLVNTSDESFRKDYKALAAKKYNSLKNILNRINVDMIQLRSDEPYEVPLKKFFRMRLRKG